MIDIHSHILPGFDDGSKSMEETLLMVRQLERTGFKTIVATPHVLEGTDYLKPGEILAATEQVNRAVAEAGVSVEIVPGAENYIFPDMAKWVREGRLLTLGNTGMYILVELPMMEIPRYTDQVFFELQVKGLIPVLAHPERYLGLLSKPEQLIEWAKRGILFQIDLGSLRGRYGPQPRQLAERMLSSGLIHLVGSDAHRVSRNESSNREVLQKVWKSMGEERFQEVTVKNPKSILKGEIVRNNGDYVLKDANRKKKVRSIWEIIRR
ncbi:capsular polysaccharide biosynthesis protein [Desulfosporosinus acidiphilus SJ4]|uniref:protein-tyrosine-phosphatase n=1 Tax=Desulfosporosinus acidiphilus (strain DSM 22704 / JCM 16185 / SJ4) TaxID=646529 RepID=I4DBG7_DESAJ|nr:CpsB/CapC family capsule biosynthesis tyrosine phosphatase [Desulfosporosinus acidiphilus]AFM43141.1 capsular polysaccharide biosynthesis protein [Desulfosporosinus acidiphilus SJ4]